MYRYYKKNKSVLGSYLIFYTFEVSTFDGFVLVGGRPLRHFMTGKRMVKLQFDGILPLHLSDYVLIDIILEQPPSLVSASNSNSLNVPIKWLDLSIFSVGKSINL